MDEWCARGLWLALMTLAMIGASSAAGRDEVPDGALEQDFLLYLAQWDDLDLELLASLPGGADEPGEANHRGAEGEDDGHE